MPRGLAGRAALACACACACAPLPSGARLAAGEVLASESARPPPADAPWAPITLPDRWRARRPDLGGSVWYRFEVPAQAGPGPWAVYLPKVNMTAAIFVDDVWVGDGGPFTRPYPQHWNRPLLFPFARPDLAEGPRRLHVRVAGYAHDLSGLAPLFVGTKAGLQPAWAHRFAWQVQMSRLASVLAALLGLSVGALAIFRRREDATYGAFAVACALYFVHSLAGHVRDIDVPYAVGRWLVHQSMDGFAYALMFTVHRWAGLRRPRLERAALALAGLLALATASASDAAFLFVANLGHAAALAVGLYTYAVVLSRWGRLRRLEMAAVLGVGPVPLVACGHLLAIQLGLLPPEAPRIVAVIAPALLVGIAVVVLGRFLRALTEAERRRDELEGEVAARERELRASYAARRAQDDAALLAGERERMMREMHDGLGGRLVSMMAAVEEAGDREALKADLEGALDEMRTVIDSLDPDVEDLAYLLGLLRARVERRLAAAGVRLVWVVTDLPALRWLGPRSALDITRIVEEAITNVLKHAGATQLTLRTEAAPGPDGAPGVVVELVDDGRWRPSSGGAGGRGLHNMRARAAALGGSVDVGPGPGGGARVRLWLPVEIR